MKMGRCPGEESNLHALAGTGPQPAAYAYSATGATAEYYTADSSLVNFRYERLVPVAGPTTGHLHRR